MLSCSSKQTDGGGECEGIVRSTTLWRKPGRKDSRRYSLIFGSDESENGLALGPPPGNLEHLLSKKLHHSMLKIVKREYNLFHKTNHCSSIGVVFN